MSAPREIGLSWRPFDNLGLKAISLTLAFGLWSVVPDPSVPHVITGVQVVLQDMPPNLALAEPFTTTLDITVRGATARTRDLVPGQLSPRIDMFGAFLGDNLISITADDINAPFGVTVVRIDPPQVRLNLDERIRAELPVSAVVEGNPAVGFEIDETLVEPAVVAVTGARSRIERLVGLSTEVINVTGRRESLRRSVSVVADDPLIEVDSSSAVQTTVVIQEIPVNRQIDGLTVAVVNGTARVDVNPSIIVAVLRGPPSLLDAVTAADLIATIDVAGLAPSASDYQLEPTLTFVDPAMADDIEIIAVLPQRRLDVHVWPEGTAR